MDASCIYIHSLYIIQVGRELRRQCTHAQQLCVPCHLFVLFVFIISFSSSFFFFLFGKSKWQFQISASLPCWCHRLSFSRTDSFVWIHGYGRVGRMVPRAWRPPTIHPSIHPSIRSAMMGNEWVYAWLLCHWFGTSSYYFAVLAERPHSQPANGLSNKAGAKRIPARILVVGLFSRGWGGSLISTSSIHLSQPLWYLLKLPQTGRRFVIFQRSTATSRILAVV